MVKTTITTTIDTELKEKAMPIIQNKLNKTFAQVFSEALKRVIEEEENGNR